MKKLLLLSVLCVFTLSGPTFAAVVYTGSQPVTITVGESATIDIAGMMGFWDNFIVDLRVGMGMGAMMEPITLLTIHPGGMAPAQRGCELGLGCAHRGQPLLQQLPHRLGHRLGLCRIHLALTEHFIFEVVQPPIDERTKRTLGPL